MEYRTIYEMAIRWNVSRRSAEQYCRNGRIAGVKKFGRNWAIPKNAERPKDRRKEENRNIVIAHSSEMYSETTKVEGFGKVGAVIVAAGVFSEKAVRSPFFGLGDISLIKRIILILQQANVEPIVIITGYDDLELKHHLSNYRVVFLYNENYKSTDKLYSAKIGLTFLKDKCNKIFFTSLRVPMFTQLTLKKMLDCKEKIVIPRYKGKNGHPLLLSSDIIGEILHYQGDSGMRGAISRIDIPPQYVDVDDEGILLQVQQMGMPEEIIKQHDASLLHPFLRISIDKQKSFFDERTRMLLTLIEEVHSVQEACKYMALSKGMAWKLIDKMESELGFLVVQRHRGGNRNRKTCLTEKGKAFYECYREYEAVVNEFAKEKFKTMFADYELSQK